MLFPGEVTMVRRNRLFRTLLMTFFSGIVIITATFVIAELIVRDIKPVPSVQVIKLSKVKATLAGPSIFWVEDPNRNQMDCASTWPDARVAVFSGDSIFFGSGVGADEVFTFLLQKKLDQEYGRGSWCVVNLSQPAFSFEQKMEWLRQFATGHRIDHVYWEVWFTENVQYRVFNGSAYNFGPVAPPPGHIPDIPVIPLSVSEWMFAHSKLYEYAFLTFQPRHRMSRVWWDEKYIPELKKLREWIADKGAELTLVPAVPLDRPFSVSTREIVARDKIFFRLKDYTDGDVVFLADALEAAGADFEKVRHDPCCHFNAAGHQFLADIFMEIVVGDAKDAEAKKADK